MRSWVRLAGLALAVRAGHLALCLGLSALLPDYDTSADLGWEAACGGDRLGSQQAARGTAPAHGASSALAAVARRLVLWDTVFYTDIACSGYQYEQQYAFFPLLPALLRLAGPELMPTAGLLLSLAASASAACLLLQLGRAVTRDQQLASAAALLFLLSPSAVFQAAIYTEPLFCALTFLGLCMLYACSRHVQPSKAGTAAYRDPCVGHLRRWAAACCFTLACCARSNGVINAGFLAHDSLAAALHSSKQRRPLSALLHLASGALSCATVAVPLVAHQAHAASSFCGSTQSSSALPQPLAASLHWLHSQLWEAGAGSESTSQAPQQGWAQPRPWCGAHPLKPSVYGYVQERYWGVGLLKYWRLSQVPNFLLAAPALLLTAAGCWAYARAHPAYLASGGLFPSLAGAIKDGGPGFTKTGRGAKGSGQQACKGAVGQQQGQGQQQALDSPDLSTGHASGFFAPAVAVFVYPWAFMGLTALLVMHVQVATRFLSSCPALFWFMAHLWLGSSSAVDADAAGAGQRPLSSQATGGGQKGLSSGRGSQQQGPAAANTKGASGRPSQSASSGSWVAKALWGWCFAYLALGSVLFTNFYPWT